MVPCAVIRERNAGIEDRILEVIVSGAGLDAANTDAGATAVAAANGDRRAFLQAGLAGSLARDGAEDRR